ncbi:2,3-epoxybenzoyl-CoA dihydrolase, partial [Amycolatopsis pithecellobii]
MTTVSFDREPASYRHWHLRIEPPIAWLELDVDEQGGLVEGYELKLNSYDLGVDIELYDAVQRLRFEHPEVAAVVITSAKEKVFCAGANIRMLAGSPHEWKVNFCKFTNETRNGIEDATENSGQTYIAAVNGSCAGGGYEMALACEEIILVDDNSSTVALPEVSLLGVLPGTGGLTRLVDKRGVRKDRADVFATRPDGIRGKTAVDWRLVDELVPRRQFREVVHRRAGEIAARSTRPADAKGIKLGPLERIETGDEIRYRHVTAKLGNGLVEITVHGPGADDWFLAMTRELDDLILRLRVNEPELGTWVIRTEGDPVAVLDHERRVLGGGDWLCKEMVLYFKRTLKRLDVTSRSLIALVEPGSCFAGMLLELALACDRQYMLDGEECASVVLSEANFGVFPMGNGLSRVESRFYGESAQLDRLKGERDRSLGPVEAVEWGLVTDAPDELDWDDEIRIVLEGRAALSPDALTGMEANHRFVGPETMETKIFGR